MSPSMIFRELSVIFPEFKIRKYGRVDDHTIWFERDGVNGRSLFTLEQKTYILKEERKNESTKILS